MKLRFTPETMKTLDDLISFDMGSEGCYQFGIRNPVVKVALIL
jgi:hypothetical protein